MRFYDALLIVMFSALASMTVINYPERVIDGPVATVLLIAGTVWSAVNAASNTKADTIGIMKAARNQKIEVTIKFWGLRPYCGSIRLYYTNTWNGQEPTLHTEQRQLAHAEMPQK